MSWTWRKVLWLRWKGCVVLDGGSSESGLVDSAREGLVRGHIVFVCLMEASQLHVWQQTVCRVELLFARSACWD